jgi:putative FmdB family regulatory protein
MGDGVPIYEFLCRECGPFEQQRSFAEASDPMRCPSCGLAARRTYTMPATKNLPAAFSNAMDRVEKSVHEPEVVRHPVGSTLPGTRYHPGHGGHHGHNH